MYRLIFQSGPQRGRRVVIRQGPVILGRHPDAALRLPEPEVALQHALLEDQPGGGVLLRRLGAEGTVLVNQQSVATAELRDSDLIAIGPHVLQFQSGQAPAAQSGGRRLGILQTVTLLAVGLLLAGQMIFLFLVSVKPPTPAVAVVPPAVTETAQVAAVATTTSLVVRPVPALPAPVASVPTVTPTRVAVAAPPPAGSVYSNEMNQMRTDIARLHRDVEALPPLVPQIITNLVMPVVAAMAPPPAPATNMPSFEFSADDLVLAQARKMFVKTMARAAQLDPDELDGELATIQNMAPDFLPPIIERAQLMARRNQRADALTQWQQIRKLAQNEDLRARAVDEIAKLQKILSAPPEKISPKPEVKVPAAAVSGQRTEIRGQKSDVNAEKTMPGAVPTVANIHPLPSTISPAPSVLNPSPSAMLSAAPRSKPVRAVHPVAHILGLESQKLLAGDKYDEMRLLRITVAALGAAPLDPATTAVVVTFFDRGESSGHVALSRAVVPGAALHAAPLSSPDAPLEFSASYLVPRDLRKQAARQAGEATRFFGYRVELFCHGELQEQRDHPANLLPAE
jgi:hypothetical protein